MNAPTIRDIHLGQARLPAWVGRFRADHGGTWGIDDGDLLLTGDDGTRVRLHGWFPVPAAQPGSAAEAAPVSVLTDLSRAPRWLPIVLVRRGGYAVGLGDGADLTAHKAGTRYVQGRSAAGGWSQQRYARRRSNQADALLGAVAVQASRILGAWTHGPLEDAGLVLGGDRALLDRWLDGPARVTGLDRLRDLPRRYYPDVPNPRHAVLVRVLADARSVRARITHPPA